MQASMGLPQFSQVASSVVVPAILVDVHADKLIILLFIYLTVTDSSLRQSWRFRRSSSWL